MTHTVLGTCHHDCPDSCGWIATVDNGVAVSLRGNPAHPYSAGELCPKVNRLLDRVYAKDRITSPLIRTGAKGSGEFRTASWDEALNLVAENVERIVADHGGESILGFYDAGTQGLLNMTSLDRRFFANLGASRLTGSLCGVTAREGFTATYGSGLSRNPTDIQFADFVVLWGTNTRLTNRHLWPFVERAQARGATVCVIDPLRTMTASSADWFIQPRPGTDIAFMLAVMHVLIRDGLVDLDYIDRFTSGFGELSEHVSTWTPQRAAQHCGVPAEEIERFAEVYGGTKASFIRTLIGAEHSRQGAMFFRTLGCLPLLTGAWRVRGGGLSRSVGAWFGDAVDGSVFDVPWQTRGLNMNHLGRHLNDPTVAIHGLFIWNANPVVSVPNSGAIRQGLERDDLFCVVSEQFLTDTARYADVVFPATTQLEQLDVVEAWGHLYLGWNEPAIEPIGECVPNTELWRRLAAACGMNDPEFAMTDTELIELATVAVDRRQLRCDGFIAVAGQEASTLYAEGGFATPNGKANLASVQLADLDAVLPDFRPEALNQPRAYPFQLLSPKRQTRFLNSSYSHHHGPLERPVSVEICAQDLAAMGLEDGERVEVHNDNGSLVMPVRLSDLVPSGVVAIPYGWWGESSGVNKLTDDSLTDWGGGVTFHDTWVAVRPLNDADVTHDHAVIG